MLIVVISPREPLKVLQYFFLLMNNSNMYKTNPTWGCSQLQRGNETEIASCWCTINVCYCSLIHISLWKYYWSIGSVHCCTPKYPVEDDEEGRKGRTQNISDNAGERTKFWIVPWKQFTFTVFSYHLRHKQGNNSETAYCDLWYHVYVISCCCRTLQLTQG